MSLALEVVQGGLDLGEKETQDHNEAMNCRKLEDLLRFEIDLSSWLQRADEIQREDIYSGNRPHVPEDSLLMDSLYSRLLKIFRMTEPMVKLFADCDLDHLDEYRKCSEKLANAVESRSWAKFAAKSCVSSNGSC